MESIVPEISLTTKPVLCARSATFRGRPVRAFISIPLAGLFVLLAALNLWIVLTSRAAYTVQRRIWTQVHRICGYTFHPAGS